MHQEDTAWPRRVYMASHWICSKGAYEVVKNSRDPAEALRSIQEVVDDEA